MSSANHEQGFVQGALLIGVAILAIIIGAFAMSSSNNTSDISAEKQKTNAAVAVMGFATAFEGYQINAANTDIASAAQAMGATGPSGTKKVDLLLQPAFTAAPVFLNGILSGSVIDAGTCAYINKVLGVTTGFTDNADGTVSLPAGANALTNGESCYSNDDGWVYEKDFGYSGSSSGGGSGGGSGGNEPDVDPAANGVVSLVSFGNLDSVAMVAKDVPFTLAASNGKVEIGAIEWHGVGTATFIGCSGTIAAGQSCNGIMRFTLPYMGPSNSTFSGALFVLQNNIPDDSGNPTGPVHSGLGIYESLSGAYLAP